MFNFILFPTIILLLIIPLQIFILGSVLNRNIGIVNYKKLVFISLGILNFFNINNFIFSMQNDIVIILKIIPSWINVGMIHLNLSFVLDNLNQVMSLLIISIASIVIFYSFFYLEKEPYLPKFISYLFLFIVSMEILINAENMFLIFCGWELVGLCSFLLIGFWYTRLEARKAALKAIVINRIGDSSLIAAMGVIYSIVGSNQYYVIFLTLPYLNNLNSGLFTVGYLEIINLLIFIGAMAKSAQMGLHIWLLEAMEAPTPVSALLHAATMVTAGAYLLMRFSYIYEYMSKGGLIYYSFMLICTVTIFYSSLRAVYQRDIKKIIAYSTASQLGIMMIAIVFSNYNLALFHLFNHAFTKSLLFLSAGLIIHAMSEEQDLRKMGGLSNLLPLTYTFILIASMSLGGMPFLSCFYSKEAILELLYFRHSKCYLFAGFGSYLTILYSVRLLCMVFWTGPNGFKNTYLHIPRKEASIFVLILLTLLALCSIFSGYVFGDLLIGEGSSYLNYSIFNIVNLDQKSDFFREIIAEKKYYLIPIRKLNPLRKIYKAFFLSVLFLYYNLRIEKIRENFEVRFGGNLRGAYVFVISYLIYSLGGTTTYCKEFPEIMGLNNYIVDVEYEGYIGFNSFWRYRLYHMLDSGLLCINYHILYIGSNLLKSFKDFLFVEKKLIEEIIPFSFINWSTLITSRLEQATSLNNSGIQNKSVLKKTVNSKSLIFDDSQKSEVEIDQRYLDLKSSIPSYSTYLRHSFIILLFIVVYFSYTL